jgi:hypothetical protein
MNGRESIRFLGAPEVFEFRMGLKLCTPVLGRTRPQTLGAKLKNFKPAHGRAPKGEVEEGRVNRHIPDTLASGLPFSAPRE